MSPKFRTVFPPAKLVDLEPVALAPHQLTYPSLVQPKLIRSKLVRPALVRRRIAGRNVAAKFRKKLTSMRAGQFLLAVTEHSAECGIGFQNPAIQPANPDSNRRPFKHRLEQQIVVVNPRRRKLGNHVHTVTTTEQPQVSGLRCQVIDFPFLRPDT